MVLFYICLLAVTTTAFAGELQFSSCGGTDDGIGQILSIRSSQFSPGQRIQLKRRLVYDFEIKFVAGENAESFLPNVYGVINGVPTQWHGVNRNACADLVGEECPLVAGRTYTYFAKIPILPTYPAVSLEFQWALTSLNGAAAKGNNQICFRMPVTIVN